MVNPRHISFDLVMDPAKIWRTFFFSPPSVTYGFGDNKLHPLLLIVVYGIFVLLIFFPG